ncbi:hypothetical protein [Desulfovibrio sp. Huiquan2017]|uniref:hypothetical protein n=1 Tax=Desulfovibrio sp. Huiquan2017 TaxID=2816861 RepID=UPI001A914CF2|nr:hypothetical protein [Desulfovibrio sp. Huiquan2017]
MAYISEDMRLMGGVPGQQLFIYRSEDDAATVAEAGYFDQAAEDYNLETGDIVIACTGVNRAAAIDLMVAADTGGTVTVITA